MVRRVAAPRVAPGKRFAHFSPYRFNNSPNGLARAVAQGYGWIDLDQQVDADGVMWCTHWHKPLLHDGFRDPKGKIPHDRPIQRMRTAEVRRLRHPDGTRILTTRAMLRLAHRRGLRVELEAKDAKAFQRAETWVPVMRTIKRLDLDVQVKTISNLGRSSGARLRAAKKAASQVGVNVPTILLPRGSRRMRKRWWPWIDYVRGPVKWVGVAPRIKKEPR